MSGNKGANNLQGSETQGYLEHYLLDGSHKWLQEDPGLNVSTSNQPQSAQASKSSTPSVSNIADIGQYSLSGVASPGALNNPTLGSMSFPEQVRTSSKGIRGLKETNVSYTSATSPSAVKSEVGPFHQMTPERRCALGQASKGTTKNNTMGTGPSKLPQTQDELAAVLHIDQGDPGHKLKGRVRTENGILEWHDYENHRWRRAAYHSSWRHDFIEMDRQNSPYVEDPAHGSYPLDITSNCSYLDQHGWRFDTSDQLALILDDDGNKVMELGQRPVRLSHPEPRLWIHHGLVMLDTNGNPVVAWPNIPRCFSSALEGGRMEALKRVFPWLQTDDFRARMPRTIESRGRTQELYGLCTFRHRICRWRKRLQLPAWDHRSAPIRKKGYWHDDEEDVGTLFVFALHAPETPTLTVDRATHKRPISSVENDDENNEFTLITKRQRSSDREPGSTNPYPTPPSSSTPENNDTPSALQRFFTTSTKSTSPSLSSLPPLSATHRSAYKQEAEINQGFQILDSQSMQKDAVLGQSMLEYKRSGSEAAMQDDGVGMDFDADSFDHMIQELGYSIENPFLG